MRLRPVFRSKWSYDNRPRSKRSQRTPSENKLSNSWQTPATATLGNPGGLPAYGQAQDKTHFTGSHLPQHEVPVTPGGTIPGRHVEDSHFRKGSAAAGSVTAGQALKRSRVGKAADTGRKDTHLPRKPGGVGGAHREEVEAAQSKVPAIEALDEKVYTPSSGPSASIAETRVVLPDVPVKRDKRVDVPQAEAGSPRPHNGHGKKKTGSKTVPKSKDVSLPRQEPGAGLDEQVQEQDSTAHTKAVGEKAGQAAKRGKQNKDSYEAHVAVSDSTAKPSILSPYDFADQTGKKKPAAASTKSAQAVKLTEDEIQGRKQDSLRIPTPVISQKSGGGNGIWSMSYAQKAAAPPVSEIPTVKHIREPSSSLALELKPSHQNRSPIMEQRGDTQDDPNCGNVSTTVANNQEVNEIIGPTPRRTDCVDSLEVKYSSTSNLGIVGQDTQPSQAKEQSQKDIEVTGA